MISAEGLTKYYGAQCAVDRINLDIKKGEIVKRMTEAELETTLLDEIEEMTGEKVKR